MTTAEKDEHDEHGDSPDDVPQRGEAQIDGCALLEPIGLRARGPLALAAGQVHQVDVGLLGDVLPGEDLKSGVAEGQEIQTTTERGESSSVVQGVDLFEKVQTMVH